MKLRAWRFMKLCASSCSCCLMEITLFSYPLFNLYVFHSAAHSFVSLIWLICQIFHLETFKYSQLSNMPNLQTCKHLLPSSCIITWLHLCQLLFLLFAWASPTFLNGLVILHFSWTWLLCFRIITELYSVSLVAGFKVEIYFNRVIKVQKKPLWPAMYPIGCWTWIIT
jgi:hypothetical protein